MDSPQILTRSQKKQLHDMEPSNSVNAKENVSDDMKTEENVDENVKSHDNLHTPCKRIQPSRLSKNPVTPNKKTGNDSAKANVGESAVSQNKVENSEDLPQNTLKKTISLWKPCESPRIRKLAVIHENGKENISLEENLLREKSKREKISVKEEKILMTRSKRRSVSTSPTRNTSSPVRMPTRRSVRSVSESRTFPDSSSIETTTKTPVKLRKSVSSSSCSLEKTNTKKIIEDSTTSTIVNDDKTQNTVTEQKMPLSVNIKKPFLSSEVTSDSVGPNTKLIESENNHSSENVKEAKKGERNHPKSPSSEEVNLNLRSNDTEKQKEIITSSDHVNFIEQNTSLKSNVKNKSKNKENTLSPDKFSEIHLESNKGELSSINEGIDSVHMDSSSEKDLSLHRLKNVIKDIKLDCNKLFAVEEKVNEESTSNVLNECVDTENKSLPTPRCSESLQKDITTVSDNDNNDDYKEGSNLTTLERDTNTCTNIINVSDKNSSLSSEQTKKKICKQESESVSSNNQLHKYKIEKELQIVLTPIKKRMQLEQCVIGDKNENICKKPVPQVTHTDDSENKRNSLDKSNEINDTTSEENLGEKILATSGTVNNSNSDDLMDTVFSVEKKSSETKEKQATQQDIIMVTADNVSENKINSLNKSNKINDTTCNENLGKKILATLGTENNSNSDDVNDMVGKKSLETKEKQATHKDIMVTTDNVSENKRNSLDESNEISDTTCNENLGEKILATSRTENNSNSDDFSDTVPSFGKKSLEAKEKQTIQQVIILGTTDNSSLEGIETSSKEGNIVVVNDETLKEDSSLDLLENSVVDYEIKQNKKETGNKIDVSNGEPVLNKAKNIEQNEILTSKLQNDKQSSKKLINSDSDILLLQHPKNEAFVTNTQTIPLQLESTGNDVEYFGTHKTFCELLDQCSPKKQNYSQDNKVSNKIIEKQSDAQSVEHEVQNDKEEIIKNSDFRSVINEDEKENKSEHEIKRDLNFEQVTEKIAQTVFETNVSNTVCNSEDSVTIGDAKNITGDTDINTVKLNSNENINSKQQNNFREKQRICLKDQEYSDEIFGASVEMCSVTVKENKNNESSNKNLAKDKIEVSQKRKNTKVEAKVELCSVVKVINNSEDILVASGKQNLFKKKNFKTKVFHESDDFTGNNEQGLEVQYIQKSEKNKTTGNGMNAKIPQAFDIEPNKKSKKNKTSTIETKDDIVKRKKEKRFVISEVKDSDEKIPESTRINSKKRLHEEIEQKDSIKTIPESNNVNSKKRLHKKDDLNIDEDDTKKVKAENKLSDDKVSENVCDQLKTNTRKLNNQFKKTLKNIDFAELLQLLTVPNEQVKLLNLSQNYLRKLKGKILKSTEYKNFTDIVQKKNIGDKKLEQNKTKSNSKATLRSDEWDRLISDEHGTVGVLNQESNESGILNILQSSDKVMKKRKRNRRKKKNQMGSVNNSSESTAEVVEINQVDTRISQIKKQNKTDIGKNLDQLTSKINKKENINRKQETDQQFIKPKLIIEDTIPLKSNQEFFAVKSDNIPTKFPEKKIKHDRFKNKEVSIKQQVNENENQRKQKLKHKMSVQPNFLKTTGSLFKVEASNVFGGQHKSIVKDPKESSICSGSLFKVEASSKSEDQRQHTVGTKEPPGFIVTDGTKGKHEITSDKSILFAGSNLQEFRNSKEYKASLELMKQNVETTNGNNMFKFSDKPKKNKRSREQTTSPRNEPNEQDQQKKVGIKRLPAELLEALSDKPLEKKKKEIPIETKEISKNKKKKLKLKSSILDESYIPLSADSATQFAVARLDKEPTLTSAQHAANFRNNQLYGVHTKRISAKDLHNMKLKIKANNKE